jgi:drug/metabolite transporter (DMT)-like permease
MNLLKIIFFMFAVFVGAFMFVFGEFDDSPGGQGLGLLSLVFGVISLVKNLNKKPRS